MAKEYEVIELEDDSVMLELPSFYSRYTGSYFYYQQRKNYCKDASDKEYTEFTFHLSKSDAKEVDQDGNIISILMCHITDNGRLPCPDEVLREIRKNNNKVFFYGKGYSDFSLSTVPESEFKTGLTTEDEEFLIKLFKN